MKNSHHISLEQEKKLNPTAGSRVISPADVVSIYLNKKSTYTVEALMYFPCVILQWHYKVLLTCHTYD